MTKKLAHYINGEFTGASDALESRNPSDTSEVVATFPDGGEAEVAAAVEAAQAAQKGWADASPDVRADLLDKVASIIFSRAQDLGDLQACLAADEYLVYTVQGQTFSHMDLNYSFEGDITSISASSPVYAGFSFTGNQVAGTYPVEYFYSLAAPGLDSSYTQPQLQTTITTYGAPGGYVIGTLQGQFQTVAGELLPLSGTYRVRRDP